MLSSEDFENLNNKKVSMKQLAEKYNVSVSTISRWKHINDRDDKNEDFEQNQPIDIDDSVYRGFWTTLNGMLIIVSRFGVIEYESLSDSDIDDLVKVSKGTFIDSIVSFDGSNNLLVVGMLAGKLATRIKFKSNKKVNKQTIKESLKIENTEVNNNDDYGADKIEEDNKIESDESSEEDNIINEAEKKGVDLSKEDLEGGVSEALLKLLGGDNSD